MQTIQECVIETTKRTKTDPITVLKALDPKIRQEFNKTYIPRKKGSNSEDISLIMNVLITGARPGEIVQGSKTQSKGALMRVHSYIPPDEGMLNKLRDNEAVWNRFLRNLNSIPFFSDTSNAEKELYFEVMQSDKDIYFEDVEGLNVDVLQMGESDLLSLPEEDIEIFSSNTISMRKLADLFKGKPGSSGLKGRHTLMFRRGIWKISLTHRESQGWKGIIVDGGEIVYETKKKVYLFDSFAKTYSKKKVEETQTLAIVCEGKEEIVDGWSIAKEIIPELTDEEIDSFKIATKNFTAASFKSLLQKLIRFRSKTFVYTKTNLSIPTSHALVCTFISLMNHPGGFVPDIQRYVTGLEAAFKRLVIILFEDSFVHREDWVLEAITTAFLAQRMQGFKPRPIVIKHALNLCISSLTSAKCYEFDIAKGDKLPPLVLRKGMSVMHAISCMVDEIKTFQSDMSMIRYIISTPTISENDTRPEFMPLEHCVDQHWAPDIVYFYPREYVENVSDGGAKPYSTLLKTIFNKVTGVNPRRRARKGKTMNPLSYVHDFENDAFVKMTRVAQRDILESRQNVLIKYPTLPSSFQLEHVLNDGWVSGLIGPITTKGIKGVPPAVVTIIPNSIWEWTAIKKPSRSLKDTSLTEIQTQKAIDHVKAEMNTKGLPLNAVPPPIPQLRGARMFLESKKYVVKTKDGKIESWDDFKNRTEIIPHIKHLPNSFLTHSGFGIVENADSIFEKQVKTFPSHMISRTLHFIDSYETTITLPSVGREGGATQGAVSSRDVGAFEVMKLISEYYPCALTRIQGKSVSFQVCLIAALEHVSRLLKKLDNTTTTKNESEKWGNIGDKRKLRTHQQSSLDQMKKAYKKGQKGHFIWMNVGMGKTLLVFSYLKFLKDQNKLPKYVIYTLPSSAIASIVGEIESFGFKYKILIPNKNLSKEEKSNPNIKHGKIPEPYHITLIEHDHLKSVVNDFQGPALESIFVIDEVHKTLNDTLRTNAAQTITSQAQGFVAMTGTPIIDTNTYKLVNWLKKITPFTITPKTFFVAVNAMVVSLQQNNIPVEYLSKEIPLKGKMLERYVKLVPESCGGKNSHPRVEDIRESMEICYEVCDEGIVDEVMSYLKKKRGVFVVAKDKTHQVRLKDMIVEKGVKDVFLIEKGATISLTDETVKEGKVKDYRVVITTLAMNAGYNLTRLNVMITGVYPSNNATREQLEGRINRIGQSYPKLTYITIHSGILSHILDRYNSAKNLSMVLEGISKE